MWIRTPTPDDAQALAGLSRTLGYPVEAAAMATRIDTLTGDTAHHLALVEREDTVAGWIHASRRYTLESGESFEIVGLVVDPRWRRQGVAAALVQDAERWARTRGAARLVVRSNVARQEAHAFYAARGYGATKQQQVYAKALTV